MASIKTVDPYLPHYVYEKEAHPEKTLVWRQYRKDLVNTVDKIVELSRGIRSEVRTGRDWEIVQELMAFFAKEWPEEFEDFRKVMPGIRSSRRAGGKSKSGEMMYVGALPPRFMKLIQAIFPDQQFDKKFIWKLVEKIPLLRVVDMNNLPKGSIISNGNTK